MSYILKALEKSEKERQQGEIPDLFDKPVTVVDQQTATDSSGMWIVVAVAIALAFTLGWLQPWRSDQQPVSTDQQSVAERKGAVVVTQMAQKSAPLPATAITSTEKQRKVTPDPAFTEAGTAYPTIYELSEPLRQTLPTINISAHIFAEKPEARLVMINGRSLHEGDHLSEGLHIKEITQTGVILQYQKRSFRMGVFEQWEAKNL